MRAAMLERVNSALSLKNRLVRNVSCFFWKKRKRAREQVSSSDVPIVIDYCSEEAFQRKRKAQNSEPTYSVTLDVQYSCPFPYCLQYEEDGVFEEQAEKTAAMNSEQISRTCLSQRSASTISLKSEDYNNCSRLLNGGKKVKKLVSYRYGVVHVKTVQYE